MDAIRIRPFLAKSLCAAAFFGAVAFTAQAHTARTPLQSEVARLLDLAENQHAAAILQLQAVLQQQPDNTDQKDVRALLLALIPLYIDAGDTQRAKALNVRLTKIGEQYHDQVASAMALANQANVLQDEGRLNEALVFIEQALAVAGTAGDKRLNGEVHRIAGDIYVQLGNFPMALQHQLSALDVPDNDDRQSELHRATTLKNIGKVYLSLKNPKMALDYNAKAGELAKKLGAGALIANVANNRGYAFADQDQIPEAIASYQEGLKIARSVGDQRDAAVALNNLADAALNQGRYGSCVQYAQEGIALSQQDRRYSLAAVAFSNLGVCHMNMGLVAQGAAESKRGIEFFRKAKANPSMELALGDLAAAYEKVGLYRHALDVMHEQRRLATELFHKERDHAVMELQARFDLAQRQKQIEALQHKDLLQTAEIKNKNLQRTIAILAIAVAVALIILIFSLYRNVRRSNKKLRDTNLKLVDQSTHDPLTGLFNRRAFQDLMNWDRTCRQSLAPDHPVISSVMILLDVDNFKNINDSFGHGVGDHVLVEIGQRLKSILRDKDMLMRWGGEEFLIYLPQLPVERIAQFVGNALAIVGSTPVVHEDLSLAVTISAGFITMPLPGRGDMALNWEKAIQLIDDALYRAKSGGRNRAIGIECAQGGLENPAALASGDLQVAVESGSVALQHIAGPDVQDLLIAA